MAQQVLPDYVERVDSAGNRHYKPEFKQRLVADIKSGRRTFESAVNDFKLKPVTVYGWLSGKHLSRSAALPGVNGSEKHTRPVREKTLVAKAREMMPAAKAQKDEYFTWQHIDLAVEVLSGRIDPRAARKALGLSMRGKWMYGAWCAKVLAWAFRNGYKVMR